MTFGGIFGRLHFEGFEHQIPDLGPFTKGPLEVGGKGVLSVGVELVGDLVKIASVFTVEPDDLHQYLVIDRPAPAGAGARFAQAKGANESPEGHPRFVGLGSDLVELIGGPADRGNFVALAPLAAMFGFGGRLIGHACPFWLVLNAGPSTAAPP